MRKHSVISAAAVAALVGSYSSVFAGYTSTTTLVPPNPLVTGTTYNLSSPALWSNGVPTATSLAVINSTSTSDGTNPVAFGTATLDANLTAYSLAVSPTAAAFVIAQANNAALTLLSEDSVIDSANGLSPALQSVNPTQQTNIRVPLMLGDASLAAGNHTAYIIHRGTAGSLQIGNTIGQAANQVWGLTIGSTDTSITDYREVNMRGDANGSNYLLNRMTITGQVKVLAKNNLRLTNNVLNYGVGLPNYLVDGSIARALNSGAVVLNAVDGTGQVTITSGGGNREVFIGANNGDGNFSGAMNNTNLRVYKIGTGTQSLGSGTSTTATTAAATTPITSNQRENWAIEGKLVAPNLASMGASTSVTTIDGGTFSYTGAGETTTSRVLNVSFRGGTLSADGSGPLVINGGGTAALTATNIAMAAVDASVSGTSQVAQNGYGLTGLSQYVGKMTLSGQQTTLATNNTFTINEAARTIDLGAGNTVSQAAGGAGAPVYTFTASQAIDRTLTLGGTNTGANTLGIVLANEATFGAKLGINKTGVGTWVLNGANTYTGTTTVSDGKLVLNGAAGTNALTNAGGVDIKGGTAQFDSSNLATITSTLNAGYAQATKFSAGQIRSSTLAGGAVLGFGDDGTLTTVRYTYQGDADLNGTVNFNDFLILQNNFGNAGIFGKGDFDFNGTVNFNDFLALQNNFGKSITGAPVSFTAAQVAAIQSFAATVPEPTSLALLGLGAAAVLRRRKAR